MKVTRKLTLAGRREGEWSSWEIELSPEDLNSDQLDLSSNSTQDRLQVMCREAQARVLACAVADGLMTDGEMTVRLSPFLGDTPEWLNKLNILPKV